MTGPGYENGIADVGGLPLGELLADHRDVPDDLADALLGAVRRVTDAGHESYAAFQSQATSAGP